MTIVFVVAVVLVAPVCCIDNGLGITPPMGWRSWNAYTCTDSSNTTFRGGNILTDDVMIAAMHAMLDTSRTVGGKPTSLASLGYSWISMDDGWQGCNCSTRQAIDPTLPLCSIAACRSGHCSWHNKSTHEPRVNKRRFPNGMKALVDYGHGLGLKVGTYLNNCICMESKAVPRYEEDVKWMLDAGFDEVKIDNCGSSHNVTEYARLFNASGKPIRIEDCHTYPGSGKYTPDGKFFCPMNMYRSGGDIHADFGSIIGEIFSTVYHNDLDKPQSQPGCWAYPDMMQIGNFKGAEPTRSHEERTHFGLWSIVSSPLVLGFDTSNTTTMDRVWSIITNPDALAVNQQWAGSPGTLVKSYPAVGLPDRMAVQTTCDKFSQGWSLENGKLIAPGSTPASSMCLTNHGVGCPPTTRAGGITQCGPSLMNCSDFKGNWTLDADKTLKYSNKGSVQCLYVIEGMNVTAGRKSGEIKLGQCGVSPRSQWTLQNGQLRCDLGMCVTVSRTPGTQLWSKPLLKDKVAVLAVNTVNVNQAFSVPLSDIPGVPCGGSKACMVHNVWTSEDHVVQADHLSLNLAMHESVYYIISSSTTIL